MNWKRIHVNLYIDLDKVNFFKINQGYKEKKLVVANFGSEDIEVGNFDTLDEAKEFIKKIIEFRDI